MKKWMLSIVVPAFKQEKTIVKDLRHLKRVLDRLSYEHELILVVDGFLDKTYSEAKKIKYKNLKVLGYKKNKGKGFAVKYGMLRGKGDVIGFIDAGRDLDPSQLQIALGIMQLNDADIVIGSKLHEDSKVNYPFVRKVLSWGYRTLTHLLFGFDVKDTQVGLKIFKKRVAKNIFSRIIVKSLAFDVEVLAVAYSLGYKNIYESPIKLDFKAGNSITLSNFWKIIILMLWDTAAIFYRLRILNFYRR